MTPYKALMGKKPSLRGLREWGDRGWEPIRSLLAALEPKSRWLGVEKRRIWWPNVNLNKVTVEYSLGNVRRRLCLRGRKGLWILTKASRRRSHHQTAVIV